MDFPNYNEAWQAGLMDGLYDRPRVSTALAYRKGYDAGFMFYLRETSGSANSTTPTSERKD